MRWRAAIAEAGLSLCVACVEGDDVLPLVPALREAGLTEAVSGAPLPARLLTANAYLGALPIRAALQAGADIVITGRCADSALALGILMHEFGWHKTAYDLLAAGSLGGTYFGMRAAGDGRQFYRLGQACPVGTISATPLPIAPPMAAFLWKSRRGRAA